MKHQLVAIILGLGITLLGFQNCSSKVSFSTKDSDLTAKSGPFEEDNQEMGLPVVPDGGTIPNDDAPNPPDLGDGTPPPIQNPPPVIITDNNNDDDYNPNDDSDHDSSGNDSNNDNDSDDDNGSCSGLACVNDEIHHENEHNCKRKEHHHRRHANHRNHDDDNDDQDNRGYVCILDSSHGKSIRLGIITQSLEAVGSTPHTVCISKNACENIASKAFDVAGSSKRGFCHDNRNPHVVQLTDEQVQTLVDKILDK